MCRPTEAGRHERSLRSEPSGTAAPRSGRGGGMSYVDRLLARERELGRPVRVGLVGAGQMGLGFVVQASRIAGMEVVAIADIAPERGMHAFAQAGRDDVLSTSDVAELTRVVEAGGAVVVEDAAVLTKLPLDVLVDA